MKNKLLITSFSLCFIGFSSWILLSSFEKEDQEKPNVILIMVDDLRPEINCYNKTTIKSPNIDQLASNSFLYENAVCNYPVCGASRASMLSGLRPNDKRFKTYKSRIDEEAPDVETLGSWFKKNGYFTLSYGKISHNKNDSPKSWSLPAWRADKQWRDYQTIENIALANQNNGVANAFEVGENLEENYADEKMVDKVISDLETINANNQPCLMAIGFLKPHLPFNAPKKYWDLYTESDLKLANNRYQPHNTPKIAMHNYAELRRYLNIPDDKATDIPDSVQLQLIHGYYACISFVDAQIGRLIQALKEKDMYDNSVIVFVGDHGWQLGEHNLWAKHCNFQTSLKVPLLLKYPGQQQKQKIESVVELIDLFPTLCALSNIETPDHTQGKSLVSINTEDSKNSVGFSSYHKGTTITTSDYAYTEWFDSKKNTVIGDMLFDLKHDVHENSSLAKDSTYKTLISNFKEQIDSLRKTNL
jgi:arylsulfatase A-like enzyme